MSHYFLKKTPYKTNKKQSGKSQHLKWFMKSPKDGQDVNYFFDLVYTPDGYGNRLDSVNVGFPDPYEYGLSPEKYQNQLLKGRRVAPGFAFEFEGGRLSAIKQLYPEAGLGKYFNNLDQGDDFFTPRKTNRAYWPASETPFNEKSPLQKYYALGSVAAKRHNRHNLFPEIDLSDSGPMIRLKRADYEIRREKGVDPSPVEYEFEPESDSFVLAKNTTGEDIDIKIFSKTDFLEIVRALHELLPKMRC